jgi:hypothetical protein
MGINITVMLEALQPTVYANRHSEVFVDRK